MYIVYEYAFLCKLCMYVGFFMQCVSYLKVNPVIIFWSFVRKKTKDTNLNIMS